MNFIVTPNGIRDMVNDKSFQNQVNGNSLIFVLYEADDIARIADIALLMDTKASVSYICAPNRDDKLLCIGAIKIRMNCVIFDKELNVETSYFDRIEKLCNIVLSEAEESKNTAAVLGVKQVKQIVETHENVVVSDENEYSDDVASENSSDVGQTEVNDSSENEEYSDDIEKSVTEEIHDENICSSDVFENNESVESASNDNVTNSLENSDDTDGEALNRFSESEQDDEQVEENAESNLASESFDAEPDDVEEPDVDAMFAEKENDSVDDKINKPFNTGHESNEESQKLEEYDEEPLPEGVKEHPFDTRNSNGLDDRQQAVYNIIRMAPPKEGAMTLGEYINAIISIVTLTDDESLIEGKIHELVNGSILWNRIKDCLEDIREVGR